MAVPPICGPGPITAAERKFNDYIKYGGDVPPPLGLLIRLYPKSLSALPSHPSLPSSPNQPTTNITSYSSTLLLEAHAFITKIVPRVFATEGKARAIRPASALVELSSHKVPQAEVPFSSRPAGATGVAETWTARASEHVNAAREGTASWEEFEEGIGVEGMVGGAGEEQHVMLDWGKELDAELDGDAGLDGWEDVHAEVREEVVKMPAMVDDRAFTTLVVSARREGEVLIVRVPVEGAGLPGSKDDGAAGMTAGQRASVEHGVLVENGSKYQWRKAVSVDAGGMLPGWAQKMSGSGDLAKEVGTFVDWAHKQRSGKPMP